MKLGLISDVHGDPLALELAWAHLRVMGADRIVCAGDLVGYGPRPDRVVKFLDEHKITSVRGNHDRWALQRGLGGVDEHGGGPVDAATLKHLDALCPSLEFRVGDLDVMVAHGAPGDDLRYITAQSYPPEALRGLLEAHRVGLLVVGHTHRPMLFRCDLGMVVNPGSIVSAAAVRTSRTFALADLEAGTVGFHDVETGRAVRIKVIGA